MSNTIDEELVRAFFLALSKVGSCEGITFDASEFMDAYFVPATKGGPYLTWGEKKGLVIPKRAIEFIDSTNDLLREKVAELGWLKLEGGEHYKLKPTPNTLQDLVKGLNELLTNLGVPVDDLIDVTLFKGNA